MNSLKGNLKKISIKNFRSFEDIEISLNKINIIVGRNDNGKSNLIRAIITYLNPESNFTDDDRLNCMKGRKSITVPKDQIKIIGELAISLNETEKIVKIEKQNDKYYCEDDDVDYSEYLPDYKVIDLIDDITEILHRRFFKIEKMLREVSKYGYNSSGINSVLDENSHLMKFNNIVDVIIDILQENEYSLSEKDILNELNAYLKDFWINGSNHSIIMSDGKIKATDSNSNVYLENRGTGFQSFIYIFIKMIVSARLLEEDNGLILVEEPEKMLHPQAQRDFIKAVEALSESYENCKFIITTHSPIIINHSDKGSIMLLQKDKCGITSIKTKSYEHNWKDLRSNLGVLPSDSLIFGKINLIVEGASEYLYIKKLLRKTKIGLDLDNISVINAGGAANIEKLVKVTKGEEAILNKIVVLVDGDKEGSNSMKALEKEGLIESKYIVQLEANGSNDKEIAFEDIFPKEIRFQALEEVHSVTEEEIKAFIQEEDIDVKLTWAKKIEMYLKSKDKSINKIDLCKHMIDNMEHREINKSIVKLAKILQEIQIED